MTSTKWYDANGHEYTIRGDVTPFVRGNRHGHPDSWTPDEGGEVDFVEAVGANHTVLDREEFKALFGADALESAEDALANAAGEQDYDEEEGE